MVLHTDKLSAVLMKARTSKGYSQTYVAKHLRISQKAYSYIESGHTRLELSRFLKIAQLTETHPMDFIEKISEGTPSWECRISNETAMSKDIENLAAQIRFLKSENSFLRVTIDKILQKEEGKDV